MEMTFCRHVLIVCSFRLPDLGIVVIIIATPPPQFGHFILILNALSGLKTPLTNPPLLENRTFHWRQSLNPPQFIP